MNEKNPANSKTVWVNAVLAVVIQAVKYSWPHGFEWLTQHWDLVFAVLCLLNLILRRLSHQKLSLEVPMQLPGPISRRLVAVAAIIFLFSGAKCASVKVLDPIQPVAADANDTTLIIESDCAPQPIAGYAYCRRAEGGSTADSWVSFIVPPTECLSKESCATVSVYFPGGAPTLSVPVPLGQTRVKVTWSDIVKRQTFEKDDRGFWPVRAVWRWIGPDRREYQTVSEGEIRLRVISKGYEPLSSSAGSEVFAWKWSEGPWLLGYSTAGRSAVWR